MRATLIVAGALIAAVFITQLHRNVTAATCSDACEQAYAACSKTCKQTDCFTKCINEKESCLAQCR